VSRDQRPRYKSELTISNEVPGLDHIQRLCARARADNTGSAQIRVGIQTVSPNPILSMDPGSEHWVWTID